MINLFCGHDQREAIGWHVFAQSVIARASAPVALIPLSSMGLSHGSNAFTLSRFLIPWIMDFKGHAIFADASDMLMLGDLAELDSLFDHLYAVQVVKHERYNTKHKIKYRGTDMECPNMDYPRKNWTSLMILNCEHPSWSSFSPVSMDKLPLLDCLQLKNCQDSEIGELPDCWNRLVDEGHEIQGAKLMHWTAGVPGFQYYSQAPGAPIWHSERAAMESV